MAVFVATDIVVAIGGILWDGERQSNCELYIVQVLGIMVEMNAFLLF